MMLGKISCNRICAVLAPVSSAALTKNSLRKALTKRPVSENAIERLVDRVERRLQETTETEIPTALLGDLVLQELAAIDPVAAARFASVFRRFERAEDYARFFEKEIGRGDPPGSER